MLKLCPPAEVNWNTTCTSCWLPSASGRLTTCRYWAARGLSSTQPAGGIVTLMLVEPDGLGEADGDGDADAELDADADEDAEEDPEDLGVAEPVGGAPPEAVVVGSAAGLCERGPTHGAALAAPDRIVICTGSVRPSAVISIAVTPTRLTGSCVSFMIQSASGALAPCWYPFGPA